MNRTDANDDLIRAPTASELAQIHSWIQVWLQRLADAILQPATFLAAIVWLFGGSVLDVGVIASAAAMSYALGSVIMPFALAKVDDIRLVLLGASVVRAVASAIVAIVGWKSGSIEPRNVVTWLVIGLLFYQISSAANVSRNPRSFIANVDQPTSARSRQAVGALAGIIGGIVAWRALGSRDLAFEQSAGMLLFLAGTASLASVWFQITAPVRHQDLHHKLPVPGMHEIETVLQTGEIRRYLGVRLLFGSAAFADPFLIIYGMATLRLSLWYLGATMLAVVLAQIIGGLIWTFFGDMPGSRKAIQLATALRFGAIVLALAIPFLGTSGWYRSTFDSSTLASWSFVGVFFVLSLAQNTYTRNEQHYAMRRMPDRSLFPAVDMVLNASLVATALTPILGALLIRTTSLRTAISVAAALAFIAFLSTAFLAARKRVPRRRLTPGLRHDVRPVRGRSERTGHVKIRRVKR